MFTQVFKYVQVHLVCTWLSFPAALSICFKCTSKMPRDFSPYTHSQRQLPSTCRFPDMSGQQP